MKYFKYEEFDSPDLPGSGRNMKSDTLSMLDRARGYAGIPFIILSGYRTEQHNAAVGGVSGSAHTRGYAADIRVTSQNYGTVLASLIRAGFSRIGLAQGYIHVDNDPDKPTPAVWTYDNSQHLQRLKELTLQLIEERNAGRTVNYGLLAGLLLFTIYLFTR